LWIADQLSGHRDHRTGALIGPRALGVVNAIIRPILVVLTLPLTLLTLGSSSWS